MVADGGAAAEDLGAALEARLARKGVALACDLGPTRMLRCDGFAITRLLERLRSTGPAMAPGLALTLAEGSEETPCSASRRAATVARPRAVAAWLATPLSPGMTGFTGRRRLHRPWHRRDHRARRSGPRALRFALPLATPDKDPPLPAPCSTISTC
jgi:DNA polymerase-3 subunit epsilon